MHLIVYYQFLTFNFSIILIIIDISFVHTRRSITSMPIMFLRVFSLGFIWFACTADAAAISPLSCTDMIVKMRPDNYLWSLRFFGRCLNGCVDKTADEESRYDAKYCDAVRRTMTVSCHEFVSRPEVLPAIRRLVYDTVNLYLERVGRTTYDHESSKIVHRIKGSMSASASKSFLSSFRVPFVIFCLSCAQIIAVFTPWLHIVVNIETEWTCSIMFFSQQQNFLVSF